MTTNKQYVFVYGSLLQGFPNHRLLQNSAVKQGDKKYVTKLRYRMVSFGGFPAVLKALKEEKHLDFLPPSTLARSRSKYRPIVGEVYAVDDQTLKSLDRLEGNGFLYKREQIKVEGFDKPVWMYIFMKETDAPEVALDENRCYSWAAEAQKKSTTQSVKKES